MLPPKDQIKIGFAHPAYRLAERFEARNGAITHVEVRTPEALAAHLPECDVLLVSMLWKNALAAQARKLKFIQSISAGIDQYDRDLLRKHGIRLASAVGVNANAVAEHAVALMLSLKRHLHTSRDNQAKGHWRGMISEIAAREDELAGKVLLIVGLGRIGARLATLARAFDMKVLATRRDPGQGAGGADAVFGHERLPELLPQADVVVLTCPLTPATENLIDARALALMKPSANLINVARGRLVEEHALIEALQAKRIAAAALDVTRDEPLPSASPLWAMPNVVITSHTAGETQAYEDRVIDLLLTNLDRLWRGEATLVNQVV
jgi:phosphoglycerate dehydrogenase-like enzyme